MKTLKIALRANGRITQVPDSQKLFGSLMYSLSETNSGSADATAIAQSLRTNQSGMSDLSLSSLIPEGYVPAPKEFLLKEYYKVHGEAPDKEKRRKFSQRDYVPEEKLSDLISGRLLLSDCFPYIHLDFIQDIRVGIESEKHDIPGLFSNLYSVPGTAPALIKSNGEKPGSIENFCFYLTLGDSLEETVLENLLNRWIYGNRVLILGNRSSQGYNVFTLTGLTDLSCSLIQNSKRTLNLGKLLPYDDLIDYPQSSFRLFASQRRPYNDALGWAAMGKAKNPYYYISFISEGSVLAWKDPSAVKHGRSIESPYNPSRDIIFGNAFQYPINQP